MYIQKHFSIILLLSPHILWHYNLSFLGKTMESLPEFVGTVHIFLGPYRGNPIALYMRKDETQCHISPRVYPWNKTVGTGETPNKAAAAFEAKWKENEIVAEMYSGPHWEGGIKPEKPKPPPKPAAAKPAAPKPAAATTDGDPKPAGAAKTATTAPASDKTVAPASSPAGDVKTVEATPSAQAPASDAKTATSPDGTTSPAPATPESQNPAQAEPPTPPQNS